MSLAHFLIGCQLKSKARQIFLLKNPPWLPVAHRIIPKLATRIFKSLCDWPDFPTPSLPIYECRYHHCLLDFPQMPQTFSYLRTFALAWNALPELYHAQMLLAIGWGKGVVSAQMLVSQKGIPPSLQSKPLPTVYPVIVLSSSRCIIPFIYVLMLHVPSPECQLHEGRHICVCLVYCCVSST